MHVHVFFIITSHSFFECDLNKHAKTLSVLVLLSFKNQHGEHTKCIGVR